MGKLREYLDDLEDLFKRPPRVLLWAVPSLVLFGVGFVVWPGIKAFMEGTGTALAKASPLVQTGEALLAAGAPSAIAIDPMIEAALHRQDVGDAARLQYWGNPTEAPDHLVTTAGNKLVGQRFGDRYVIASLFRRRLNFIATRGRYGDRAQAYVRGQLNPSTGIGQQLRALVESPQTFVFDNCYRPGFPACDP